jgi:LacI family transcriptional regulator
MSVTIKDIAKETGLSVTTVSLVLNNKPSKISTKKNLL